MLPSGVGRLVTAAMTVGDVPGWDPIPGPGPVSHSPTNPVSAQMGVWQAPKRELPPPGERPVRQTVPQPQRDLPDAPVSCSACGDR